MNNKISFKDLFQVNIRYLEYLLEKSYLSHQYFNNIRLSGDQVENEFRKILSSLLPKRYKITYGYIAFAPSRESEPIISGQLDIIIVDTLVPHSIYILEEKGMEVVPLECVVGIFEVKRTVNPKILGETLDYLYSVQDSLAVNKRNSETYFPAGVKGLGVMYSNPLIGILSLAHKEYGTTEEYQKEYGKVIEERVNKNRLPDLDIWASLGSNIIMATHKNDDPKMLWAYTLRENGKKYPFLFKLRLNSGLSQAYFLSISLGFILFYISNITGRVANLENYFFNEAL